jgi:hypothetical protein
VFALSDEMTIPESTACQRNTVSVPEWCDESLGPLTELPLLNERPNVCRQQFSRSSPVGGNGIGANLASYGGGGARRGCRS